MGGKMERRRVAVTGMGIVCPVGNNREDAWRQIRSGQPGIGPISLYDPSEMAVKLAGEVRHFDPLAVIDRRELRKLDRSEVFAICAAEEAVQDAGLAALTEPRDRWGVVISSGIGGIGTIAKQHNRGLAHGFDQVSPFFIPMSISNMSAGNIAIRYGLHGPSGCTVTACASAADGIGQSFHMIRDGYADLMLAGGTEAAINELSVGGFTSLKALSRSTDPARASIPFDAERNGFVMGEGAAVLVLEEYSHAQKRGAHIYAEIAGYGADCDAHHITAPVKEGTWAASCMELAMADAGTQPDQIDYINAHGTSTKLNDAAETRAIRLAFGDHASKLRVSSTKSMTGHLLGASAAVEAVFTVMALEDQFVPPTAGYRVPDPECDLDVVPGTGISCRIRAALSNSFGFGGHNGCLVFRRAAEKAEK